ncbi:MAG: NAD-dependent epimerase/dehydratase family protein [Armatimonas sp.]
MQSVTLPNVPKAKKPLRLLILGGTGLTGPHQVRYAVARGHKVTVFNRGRTHPGILGGIEVEQLLGDRNGDLKSLEGRDFDAVIDNPATLPKWVRDTAQLLKGHAQRYLFISTVSVYADNARPGQDESGPLLTGGDPNATKLTNMNQYGPLKALAEEEARKAFGNGAIIVRPGLIIGPGDETGRFLYWPLRLRKGGDVLAPGNGKDPVQYIDSRDLGEWTVRLVERDDTGGTYNAIGPARTQTFRETLEGVQKGAKTRSRLIWVPTSVLDKEKVSAWGDMPLWIPGDGEMAGFHRRSTKRAFAKGLTCRSITDTTIATLAWFDSLPADQQAKIQGGLKPEREAEILASLKKP